MCRLSTQAGLLSAAMVLALPFEARGALPSVAAWPNSLRALCNPLPAEVWDWPKDTPSEDGELPEHGPELLFMDDLKFMLPESGAPQARGRHT